MALQGMWFHHQANSRTYRFDSASEYEKTHSDRPDELQPFFDSSLPYIQHPEVKQWGEELNRERNGRLGAEG